MSNLMELFIYYEPSLDVLHSGIYISTTEDNEYIGECHHYHCKNIEDFITKLKLDCITQPIILYIKNENKVEMKIANVKITDDEVIITRRKRTKIRRLSKWKD